MAQNQNRRLRSEVIDADRASIVAIQTLSDYTPLKIEYSASTLTQLDATMEQARQAEIRAQNALAAARDAAQVAEWALHNAVLGAKTQVIAQYGPDSDAVQALGLKKKSDRRRPARRLRTAA